MILKLERALPRFQRRLLEYHRDDSLKSELCAADLVGPNRRQTCVESCLRARSGLYVEPCVQSDDDDGNSGSNCSTSSVAEMRPNVRLGNEHDRLLSLST